METKDVIPAKAGNYKNKGENLHRFQVKPGMTKRRAYFEKSIPRRLSVLVAGVTMNLILGIVCFSILYYVWGIPTKTGKVIVEDVVKNSPADLAGLKAQDWIVSVDNLPLKEGDELVKISKEKANREVVLEVARGEKNPLGYQCRGKNLVFRIVPRKSPPQGEGPLGVVINDTEMKKYPFYIMPFLGIREGLKESLGWGKMVLLSLAKMVSSLVFQGKVPSDVAGPIGIYQITGQAAKAGRLAVLQFVGILSINLAIINILPFPAMDGGRMVFLGYELFFRKKAPQRIEALVNTVGMVFLLGLMCLITINDVLRLLK